MHRVLDLLRRGKHKPDPNSDIIVVSGLPRSGTSMMMKMLQAGGLSLVTDGIREADKDNPKGYYEYERVKKLPEGDVDWLAHCRGKGVKIISALLKHLPNAHSYRVVFMTRKLEEVMASQRRMLIRRGESPKTDDDEEEKLKAMFQRHLQAIEIWLGQQSNFDLLYVSYNAAIKKPTREAKRVNAFLDGCLDVKSMARVVDERLYRQRT